MVPQDLATLCKERGVSVFDFLKEPSLTLANAALTAEGFLSVLIRETPFSLMKRKALLLGFGRCGREIGKLLRFFDMEVFVLDREESCLLTALNMGLIPATLEELRPFPWDYDVIINTVPAQILEKEQLECVPKDCVIFDIASFPFGFAPASLEELQLKLVHASGIPGCYMAKTAGELLGKAMIERMSSHGF
jgi:dipicolinate synthase subunit A